MDRRIEGTGITGEPVDWEVLARFLAGESPPAEADAVRGWLSQDPDRQAVLGALDRALDHAAVPVAAGLDVEGALQRVHTRMDAPEVPVIPFRRPERASRANSAGWWQSAAFRAAAVVLLLIGGALLFGRTTRTPAASSAFAAYSTGVGERDSVRLPDGTRVLLGPASRLTVAGEYGERTREVTLRGEAMFQVTHDDARPFTVAAGGARVRDIGTVFTVQSAPGAGVRVVVTEGAVALRAAEATEDGEMVLRQGELGVLAEGGSAPERAAATADDLAWTRGELVFRDAPLAEIAAELRRWYGISLRADDPAVADRRLTASFEGEPREQVLRVIALALGADVVLRGDTAVLSTAGEGQR
jgi:transmembrane sensor